MYKPFHEVIGLALLTAPVGITGDLRSAKAAEVAQALGFLMASKMPAAAAHEIAEQNAHLPELLRKVGQESLADLAVCALADLAGRTEESKSLPGAYSDKSPGRPQLAADIAESSSQP